MSKAEATQAAQNKVVEDVNAFRNRFKGDIRGHGKNNVFNTDQSGFNLELLTERTLDFKGTKKVMATIKSKNSATHSYTAQFLISATGELIKPLFIILQETNGEFGERVQRTMFKHQEIHVMPSSSGKLTKPLLRDWFENVYFPNVGRNSILLVDSLTTYKDRSLIDANKPENVNYEVIVIPAGLTGTLQPLDVLFNRPYKSFLRKISDYINLNHSETIKLHARDTILTLQTVTHNQFRSPRFHAFIEHSWRKSGLLEEQEDQEQEEKDEPQILRFQDPNGFCFNALVILRDQCVTCTQRPCFIKCAWCKSCYCFIHFLSDDLKNFHYCEEYIP